MEIKLHRCFVDTEKAFDRVPTMVMEWAIRKKRLSKVPYFSDHKAHF